MRPMRPCCKLYLTVSALAVFASLLLGAQGCNSSGLSASSLVVVFEQLLKPVLTTTMYQPWVDMLKEQGWVNAKGNMECAPTDFFAMTKDAVDDALKVVGLKGTVTPSAAKASTQVKSALDAGQKDLDATFAAQRRTAALKSKRVSAPPVPKAAQ